MMSPISLNPIGPSMQGQNQFFNNIPPNNQDSSSSSTSSLSCRNLFNILDRRQTLEVGDFRVKDQEDVKQVVLHDGSLPSSNNNNNQDCNSSFNFNISPHEPVIMEDHSNTTCDHNSPFNKLREQDNKNNSGNSKNKNYDGHGSAKWMPSKMRLMKKMMMRPGSSNEDKSLINTSSTQSPIRFQNHHGNNNNNGTIRVCSDCNTSTTPLWRSGPNGPKSLCNACGIRQRKARRALMAEAANGFSTSIDNNATSSTKTRIHHTKEKKSRTNHFTQIKNKCKSTTTATTIASSSSHHQGEKKKLVENCKDEKFAINFSNNLAFQNAFPRDEVAQAALLLMDLSCGFVHF